MYYSKPNFFEYAALVIGLGQGFSDPTLRDLPAFGGIISIAIRICPPLADYPIEMCAS